MSNVTPPIRVPADLPDDPVLLKALFQQREAQWQQQHVELGQRNVELEQRHVELGQQHAKLEQQCVKLEQRHVKLEQQHVELGQQHTALQQKIQELELDKLRLQCRLDALLKRAYGPRADKVGTGQMLLEFAQTLDAMELDKSTVSADAGAVNTPDAQADATASVGRHIRRGRRSLAQADHLPVLEYVHDLPEGEKPCPACRQMRQKIGQVRTWQLERLPTPFVRVEHVQLKYACRHCEQTAAETGSQIILAPKPLAPIDKGLPGPGLLAYVVTSKFADHLPLYRLENIFERQGYAIARSTMCQWALDVAELIKPVYDRMVQEVKKSKVVATDDTIMPLLDIPHAKKARMWIYRGDDDHPYNVFDFTQSRSRDGPAEFLKGYNQTLLADAYGGYDGICIEGGIRQAGCWAHARRKFVDNRDAAPGIADEALNLIGRLFAIERHAGNLGIKESALLALRQDKSVPVLQELHQKLLYWNQTMLPKHPICLAINYCLNQWKPLTVFIQDPAVRIDNNLAEQEMKRIALGRKNYLFVASERGGHTAAVLASMTSTCRRHGIDPQMYLMQLLANLPATPITQVDQWLPDVWQRRHAAQCKELAIKPGTEQAADAAAKAPASAG